MKFKTLKIFARKRQPNLLENNSRIRNFKFLRKENTTLNMSIRALQDSL